MGLAHGGKIIVVADRTGCPPIWTVVNDERFGARNGGFARHRMVFQIGFDTSLRREPDVLVGKESCISLRHAVRHHEIDTVVACELLSTLDHRGFFGG